MTLKEFLKDIKNKKPEEIEEIISEEEEEINEGLRFFKKSKKLEKAIMRAEAASEKFRFKDKEKAYLPLKRVIGDLKSINSKIKMAEDGFSSGKLSKSQAKSSIRQASQDLARVSSYAKAKVGMDVLKKSKVKWILGAFGLSILGLSAYAGAELNTFSNFKDMIMDMAGGNKAVAAYDTLTGQEGWAAQAAAEQGLQNRSAEIMDKTSDKPNMEKVKDKIGIEVIILS